MSTSHFIGSGWNAGPRQKNFGKRILLEAALIEKSTYTSSFRLKTRLLAADLKQRRYESCKNEAWLGQPIALELHHVNGVNTDNRIENLQLLCPNFHAQTETYRGKNQARIKSQSDETGIHETLKMSFP